MLRPSWTGHRRHRGGMSSTGRRWKAWRADEAREWAKWLWCSTTSSNVHRSRPWTSTRRTPDLSPPDAARATSLGNMGTLPPRQQGRGRQLRQRLSRVGSELERDVAIKILHRRVGDTRLKEHLLQEGRALAKIRHANVVNVLGIEAHEDRVGLCMEFVEGKTLADVVSSGGR